MRLHFPTCPQFSILIKLNLDVTNTNNCTRLTGTPKKVNGSLFMVQKSLIYFADADAQPEPKMYQDFNLETCKQKIIQEVLQL
jgi:hypothetical protein